MRSNELNDFPVLPSYLYYLDQKLSPTIPVIQPLDHELAQRSAEVEIVQI